MKNLKRVFAWLCAISMFFGNVSFTGIAFSELSEEITQENEPAAKDPKTIGIGDHLLVQTATVLLRSVAADSD